MGGSRSPESFAFATWIEPGKLLASAYPHQPEHLGVWQDAGVTLVLNLHVRPHGDLTVEGQVLTERHIPVVDFTPPTPAQLTAGVAVIEDELARGGVVAVHCAAGLGRTGTLVSCWLAARGWEAAAAIAEVRRLRPGSVETEEQVAAVKAFAAALQV